MVETFLLDLYHQRTISFVCRYECLHDLKVVGCLLNCVSGWFIVVSLTQEIHLIKLELVKPNFQRFRFKRES